MNPKKPAEMLSRLYYLKKTGPFDRGIGLRLPEAYRKFWREWKGQNPEPVHYIPEEGKWKMNSETGEVSVIQNVALPVLYPPEHNKGIWGGEGVIKGFQKRHPLRRRVPHFWVPILKRSVVYSEILNKHMALTVTDRTIQLIHDHYGFDHYLLKTPACDLKSELALRLKRKMLSTLENKSLYLDNPTKGEEVYNKYKQYLAPYQEGDIEWYGLTYAEACRKLTKAEEEQNKPVPLKHSFRVNLIEKLREAGILEGGVEQEKLPKGSWLSRINPFVGKKEDPSASS